MQSVLIRAQPSTMIDENFITAQKNDRRSSKKKIEEKIQHLEQIIEDLGKELDEQKRKSFEERTQQEASFKKQISHLTSLLQTSIQANGLVFDSLEKKLLFTSDSVEKMHQQIQSHIANVVQLMDKSGNSFFNKKENTIQSAIN